jgi:hypothetical protein
VSEVNPADGLTAGPRVLEEFPGDVGDFTPEPEPAKKSEREGLPASYRMRADAHYVDQLTSRRGERAERGATDAPRGRKTEPAPEADQPAAEPRERRDLRERRGDRVLAQMAEDLATIESAAVLLASDPSPAARRVSVDLVRSHAWRASFLMKAHAMLEGGIRGAIRPRPIGTLLAQVRDGFAPECRLATFALHVHTPDWNALVSVDDAAIVTGITGAVIATLSLVGPPEGLTIKITAAVGGGDLRAIEVAQDEVGVGTASALRFFDPSWSDRPGGWTAALAAAAARAAVQGHGGEAAFLPAGKRGTTIRLTFSR